MDMWHDKSGDLSGLFRWKQAGWQRTSGTCRACHFCNNVLQEVPLHSLLENLTWTCIRICADRESGYFHSSGLWLEVVHMSEWSSGPVDVGVSSLGKPQRWPSSSRTFKELVTETLRGKTLQNVIVLLNKLFIL